MKKLNFRGSVLIASLAALLGAVATPAAWADIEGKRVRIGVLNDQSGQYSDTGGAGSVVAAQLAVEEMRSKLPGIAVEVVSADHKNKADVGSAIARRWYSSEGVDAIVDVPVSSVALAVQEISRQYNKVLMVQAATSDLTGKACSPVSTHWGIDTQSMSVGPVKAVARTGASKWFFLSADYAFGQALTRDATTAILASGGKVLGNVAAPLGSTDFSSQLLRAQSSGADVIGLANAGQDLINTIKQIDEFGIDRKRTQVVAFLLFITDIHTLGLEKGQGLLVTDSFYWDQNPASRAFSQKFFEKMHRMPTTEHAMTYASTKYYLNAVAASNDKTSEKVTAWMKSNKADFFGKTATIRSNGKVVFDLDLYRIKSPGQSKKPWDYYEPVSTISETDAFGKDGANDCPIGKK